MSKKNRAATVSRMADEAIAEMTSEKANFEEIIQFLKQHITNRKIDIQTRVHADKILQAVECSFRGLARAGASISVAQIKAVAQLSPFYHYAVKSSIEAAEKKFK